METSEGDPVPIPFLQTEGIYATQSIINNTGLYLLIGIILCSFFIALAASAIALAIQQFTDNEKDDEPPVKLNKNFAYFKKHIYILHSTAFTSHILLLTALIGIGIFFFSPVFPALQSKLLYLVPVSGIIFYSLILFIAHKTAPSLLKTVNVLSFGFYWLSRFLAPLQKPLALLLRSTDTVPDAEKDNLHTTLRDILGQNSFAPNAAEEKKILKGILNFSNMYVKQIMRPRTEVISHNINTSFNQLCRYINDNRYSRVPVYEGNLDKVKGILYIKDLLPYLNHKNDFNWQALLREPYFVPETQKIDLLLQEFKRKRVHLAIVVDEYGGTSGIITLEDILEEIVGDIRDEFDEEEVNYSKLDRDNFVFEGKTPIADVTRIMNLETETFEEVRGEAETLGGLLVEMLGTIPSAGEKITYNNFCFTVENADGRRVRRVKITKQEPEEAEAEI